MTDILLYETKTHRESLSVCLSFLKINYYFKVDPSAPLRMTLK